MAGLSDEQHKLFEARLKRISRGGPNTSGHVIVGPVEPDKAPRRQRIRRPGDFISRLAGAIRHLLVVPISFALGAAAMMAGIVGGHQVDRAGLPEFAQAGILQEVVAYQEFVIAGLVVLVLGWTLRLTRGPRKIAVVTGLAAAFVLQDQIVATYPDTFARLMPDTPLVLPEIPEIAALTED